MLFFNFIEESEGIDFSKGQDVVSSTKLMSKSASHVDIITLLNKILNTKKMSVTVAIIALSMKIIIIT